MTDFDVDEVEVEDAADDVVAGAGVGTGRAGGAVTDVGVFCFGGRVGGDLVGAGAGEVGV